MPVAIRAALSADLGGLAAIEDRADRLLRETLDAGTWAPAPDGAERAAAPGFLLVAEDEPHGVVGFAHVLALRDGSAHLEQLSVVPEAGRRGIGRLLLEAAIEMAGRGAHVRMTLRTFADVPWNAPFYASAWFVESPPDSEELRAMLEVERCIGLLELGRRIQMTRPLGPSAERDDTHVTS